MCGRFEYTLVVESGIDHTRTEGGWCAEVSTAKNPYETPSKYLCITQSETDREIDQLSSIVYNKIRVVDLLHTYTSVVFGHTRISIFHNPTQHDQPIALRSLWWCKCSILGNSTCLMRIMQIYVCILTTKSHYRTCISRRTRNGCIVKTNSEVEASTFNAHSHINMNNNIYTYPVAIDNMHLVMHFAIYSASFTELCVWMFRSGRIVGGEQWTA